MLTAAATAGLLWWQQGLADTVFSAGSANGLIFFNLTFMSFRSLFVALFTFPAEQQMMIKARGALHLPHETARPACGAKPVETGCFTELPNSDGHDWKRVRARRSARRGCTGSVRSTLRAPRPTCPWS